MVDTNTVTLARAEYEALLARNEDLEDILAAREADKGGRIPHEVALAIIRGEHAVRAFRLHRRLTLRELAEKTGLAASYLSEIECGVKPGSLSAYSLIAGALGTTIDALASSSS
ncbi:MAG: helix-turn-helix transcriptional regulator [Chloroflexota bacterium]|nr:helix-turn-helix transcriptional regulator [Chloroflexota bacterium]MDE2884091.1 helix-turn-helix transcriptional regulator [Chloroflexota bacterium]